MILLRTHTVGKGLLDLICVPNIFCLHRNNFSFHFSFWTWKLKWLFLWVEWVSSSLSSGNMPLYLFLNNFEWIKLEIFCSDWQLVLHRCHHWWSWSPHSSVLCGYSDIPKRLKVSKWKHRLGINEYNSGVKGRVMMCCTHVHPYNVILSKYHLLSCSIYTPALQNDVFLSNQGALIQLHALAGPGRGVVPP